MARQIDPATILVVPKRTRWDEIRHNFALSDHDLSKELQRRGEGMERILESHAAQTEVLRALRALLPKSTWVGFDMLTAELAAQASLVFVPGGDDHLQSVAQYVDGTPVLAMNSDPDYSSGNVLPFLPTHIPAMLERLTTGDYETAPWSRLSLTVSGEPVRYALSQFSIGPTDPNRTSRVHFASFATTDREASPDYQSARPIASTGLLVCTGTGLTGHMTSAGYYLPQALRHAVRKRWEAEGQARSRTAWVLVREPFFGTLFDFELTEQFARDRLLFAELEPGHTLHLRSAIRDGGIAVDAGRTLPFPASKEARITMAERPLNVVLNPFT